MRSNIPMPPLVLTKTSTSIKVKLNTKEPTTLNNLAFSAYGYVFYSWTYIETKETVYEITNLNPNTFYAIKVATQMDGNWSDFSEIHYTRTFTEEEEAKRTGTFYEHALKLEKERMSAQITKLSSLLEEVKGRPRSQSAESKEMLSSRKFHKEEVSKLKNELREQSSELASLCEQKRIHEQLIEDLMNEIDAMKITDLKEQEEIAEKKKLLELHQKEVLSESRRISEYEALYEQKKRELQEKEYEVERIMNDCHRMIQEHTDTSHAKQLEMEDALLEAKNSLEQQMHTNALLRQEIADLTKENRRLKGSK